MIQQRLVAILLVIFVLSDDAVDICVPLAVSALPSAALSYFKESLSVSVSNSLHHKALLAPLHDERCEGNGCF